VASKTRILPETFGHPGLDRELLVFLALLRTEIQNGPPNQPLTRFDLNAILEAAVNRYLDGERP
jgi:hypothetical protein